jgi:hypothetical protein
MLDSNRLTGCRSAAAVRMKADATSSWRRCRNVPVGAADTDTGAKGGPGGQISHENCGLHCSSHWAHSCPVALHRGDMSLHSMSCLALHFHQHWSETESYWSDDHDHNHHYYPQYGGDVWHRPTSSMRWGSCVGGNPGSLVSGWPRKRPCHWHSANTSNRIHNPNPILNYSIPLTTFKFQLRHYSPAITIQQRFSNFFQVGTTFISQTVLRTTRLLNVLSIC